MGVYLQQYVQISDWFGQQQRHDGTAPIAFVQKYILQEIGVRYFSCYIVMIGKVRKYLH